ncbi:rod shape-determining protein MreC [Patescibacteria group bacterium]|nr:rod shape-determining protein MreC [Patescibacteria group bacterium]MBU1705335.1 rod shape-determining protein MreC [Patescibacteria group bacterium]
MKKYLRIILLAAALLLAVLFFQPYIGRVLGYAQSPFVQAGTWIKTHTDFIFERGEYTPAKFAALEQQRLSLAFEAAELIALRQENSLLRQQLAFVERRYLTVKTAEITSRSVSKHATHFTINQGRADGLAVGNPVVVGDGNLVGKISLVNQYSAVVTGITDLNLATPVSLLNTNRTIGIAQGTIGDLLNLNFIPHDENIAINDLVVTSGLEEFVPSGLLVGIITAVASDPNQPFQTAIIEPLISISDYSLVSVIINQPDL